MKNKDDLKTRMARIVLERALENGALLGWLDTLGELGRPPKKGEKNPVPPQTRVQAARAGIDFVSKFLGDAATSEAGQDLLQELTKLEAAAESAKEDVEAESQPTA